MTLVKIVCHRPRCRRVLLEVTETPDWTGTIRIPPCPVHANRGGWDRMLAAFGKHGVRPTVVVGMDLPAESLRAAVETAQRRGKTYVETVRGIG